MHNKKRYILRKFWLILLIIPAILTINTFDLLIVDTSAQMPDWVFLRGGKGNNLYMDRAGKLYTAGKPQISLSPIGVEGLEYHFIRGKELIAEHNKHEGLRIMKSILALTKSSGRLPEFRIKASKEINYLMKNEGDRFEKLNDLAALYLVRDGDVVYLYNDVMRYRIPVDGSIDVIRWRSRKGNGYRYYGTLIGIRFSRRGTAGANGYDCLAGIDGEIFSHPPGALGRIERHWREILGSDTFERKEILKSELRKIYEFTDKKSPHYAGFEGFMFRGKYCYCIRILSSKPVFERQRENLLKVAESLQIL